MSAAFRYKVSRSVKIARDELGDVTVTGPSAEAVFVGGYASWGPMTVDELGGWLRNQATALEAQAVVSGVVGVVITIDVEPAAVTS